VLVLDDPDDDDDVTSVHLEPLTAILIVCVMVLSVIAVVLASIICRRRYAAGQRLVVVDDDRDSSSSLRTRLTPLHSNLLYALTSDDDKIRFIGSHGGLLAAEGPTRMDTGYMGELLVVETDRENLESVESQKDHLFVEGQTKMMPGRIRRRLDELTQSISEYEIPIDVQWEFPRDRSV